MNKIKTTRSILSAVIVAAALGLVACGGGDSGANDAPKTATQASQSVTATTTPEQAIAAFGTPSQNRGAEDAGNGVTIQTIKWNMPDGTTLTLVYRNGKLWQLITSDATPDHNRTSFTQY